jgi:hypothetical protein
MIAQASASRVNENGTHSQNYQELAIASMKPLFPSPTLMGTVVGTRWV